MALSREWVSVREPVSVVVPSSISKERFLLKLGCYSENLPEVFCDQTRIGQVGGRPLAEQRPAIFLGMEGSEYGLSGGGEKSPPGKPFRYGPGMLEEDQKRIFEPFQQVNSSTRRLYGGSGLGLTH